MTELYAVGCVPGAWLLLAFLSANGSTPAFELRGKLQPATRASISLHGASAPFEDNTLAGEDGRFRFRGLLRGTYTLGVFVPGRGETRRTIEVGPAQAGAGSRVVVTVELRDSDFESRDSLRRQATVSARQLAVSGRARREYEEAEKCLARRDAECAVSHFKRALELAPQFSEAWNHLGTIAYQSREYSRAEECFRKALEADHDAFQPLVNLGGVLINLSHFEESLKYNLYAALVRPSDALANSQLGMSYFYLGQLDLAEIYLTTARRLDPAHFSHPQLLLAEIALRRNAPAAASNELKAFLQYHPDAPEAPRVKEKLASLSGPAQSFGATAMARSFTLEPNLPPLPESLRGASIDAVIGSGRHMRLLLSRTLDGGFKELPLAWYGGEKNQYAPSPGFGFTPGCLNCHSRQAGGHPAALACVNCHGTTGAGKPGEQTCLTCHPATAGQSSAHKQPQTGSAPAENTIEMNSAGYRLTASHCYQASAGKLTCTTCHPPHTFSKTRAEYRMVCRGCHPTMHNSAALDCVRCHMPQRPTREAAQITITDHLIQRPL